MAGVAITYMTYIPDPIERGWASTESQSDTNNEINGVFHMDCAYCEKPTPIDGMCASTPDPFSPAICGDCMHEAIKGNHKSHEMVMVDFPLDPDTKYKDDLPFLIMNSLIKPKQDRLKDLKAKRRLIDKQIVQLEADIKRLSKWDKGSPPPELPSGKLHLDGD